MALPKIPYKTKDHFKAVTYEGNGLQQNVGIDFGTNPTPGYDIANSLRFRRPGSTYLSRTFTNSDRTKWTFSTWVKRGLPGTNQWIFGSNEPGNQGYNFISFNTSDQIYIACGTTVPSNPHLATSSRLFRDCSKYYHIVSCLDTSNADVTLRWRVWVDGVEVLMNRTATFAQGSTEGTINSTQRHVLGGDTYSAGPPYFDGYLSNTYFIDGQVLDPTYFGQYDSLYDRWVPKAYLGTYGTNGFYLNFSDNTALTTASNVGLGKDLSGNGNYWVTNNFALTDSFNDTPTNNYCTLMSLETAVSGGGLNFTSSTTYHATPATFVPKSGVWYCEVAPADNNNLMGFYSVQGLKYANIGGGTTLPNCYGWYGGNIWTGPGTNFAAVGTTYTLGDVIGLVLDIDSKIGYWFKNNSLVFTVNLATTDDYTFMVGDYHASASSTCSVNFGQRSFTYTPPMGAQALCSKNLPFDINAPQYDLAIIKDRTAANSWMWVNNSCGLTQYLSSDTTNAEPAAVYNRVLNRRRGGFTVGNDASVNTQGNRYLGYLFRAGNTTTVNNAGTIQSNVSVNTAAGFSIVTYTGNTSANQTVGHGLPTTPDFFVIKCRGAASTSWITHHKSFGNNGGSPSYLNYVIMESSPAPSSSTTMLPTLGLTATTIPLSGATNNVNVNSANPFVAYCWHEVPGYSKFGTYTGNGSADGPFIYCGFKPAMIMVKGISASARWIIWDSTRDPVNPVTQDLYPSLNHIENNAGAIWNFDFLSNGFKLREYTGGDTEFNYPGYNFMYVAFAESNAHAMSSFINAR